MQSKFANKSGRPDDKYSAPKKIAKSLIILVSTSWQSRSDEITERKTEIMKHTKTGKCCLCGGQYTMHGCNPYPLMKSGSCCHDCDATKVVPARPMLAKMDERSADALGIVLGRILSTQGTGDLRICRHRGGLLVTAA